MPGNAQNIGRRGRSEEALMGYRGGMKRRAHLVPPERGTPNFERLGDGGVKNDLLCDGRHCQRLLSAGLWRGRS